MAADELDVPTSGKFTLAAKSYVSGNNKVTFAVAFLVTTGVAVDSGDPDHTAEVLDNLAEPDDMGMAVDFIELVMDLAGVIFFFATRRSWCVADLFLRVWGCLLLRVPAMVLVVKVFCRM